MAGRVDERQLHAVVDDCGLFRVNRDSALLLERMEVEMRIARVDAAELSDCARAEQQRFYERCFSRVDVGEYADDRAFDRCLLFRRLCGRLNCDEYL